MSEIGIVSDLICQKLMLKYNLQPWLSMEARAGPKRHRSMLRRVAHLFGRHPRRLSSLPDTSPDTTSPDTPDTAGLDLTCVCCFELLLEPTTLTCGHSFCRLCVARSYFSPSNGGAHTRYCPLCRVEWDGVPKVNTVLRSVCQVLHPTAYEAREREVSGDADGQQVLLRFNRLSSKSHTTEDRVRANLDILCAGVVATLVLVVAFYIVCWWMMATVSSVIGTSPHTPSTTGYPHQLTTWTHTDTMSWLNSLGEWTEGRVREAFIELEIEGRHLASLNRSDVSALPFPSSDKETLFWNTLQSIRRLEGPNLWSYMSTHHATLMVLTLALSDWPDLTLLYLYYFSYEDIFKPFLQITYQEEDVMPSLLYPLLSSLFPSLLLLHFSWYWLPHHFYTSLFISYRCLLQMRREVKYLVTQYNNFPQLPLDLSHLPSKLVKYVLLFTLYPILPHLALDLSFCVYIYLVPLLHLITAARHFMQLNPQQQQQQQQQQ